MGTEKYTEKKLKTVCFCVGGKWEKEARALAEKLTQAGIACRFPVIKSGTVQCFPAEDSEPTHRFSAETAKRLSLPVFSDTEHTSLLVLTDTPATAAVLKAQGIACVGCAEAEQGFFEGAEMVTEAPEELEAAELEEYLLHYHGLPVTVAKTERLILREMTEADIGFLCAFSRMEGMQYLQDDSRENFFQEDKLLAYIRQVYRLRGYGLWSVCKKDGTLIGCCGLEEVPDGRLELQYMLSPAFWHQGYATEMCRAALAYAFERLGAPQVQVRVHRENRASAALVKRLGFSGAGEGTAVIKNENLRF